MNIFEYATRNKIRFNYKGVLNVEDLWDLSLTALDNIYKTLNAQLKQQTDEESLLATKSAADEELLIKIDIVKYIFSVKQSDAVARADAIARKAQKQKIMEIIEAKKDASLQNASLEDLQKMLDELG